MLIDYKVVIKNARIYIEIKEDGKNRSLYEYSYKVYKYSHLVWNRDWTSVLENYIDLYSFGDYRIEIFRKDKDDNVIFQKTDFYTYDEEAFLTTLFVEEPYFDALERFSKALEDKNFMQKRFEEFSTTLSNLKNYEGFSLEEYFKSEEVEDIYLYGDINSCSVVYSELHKSDINVKGLFSNFTDKTTVSLNEFEEIEFDCFRNLKTLKEKDYILVCSNEAGFWNLCNRIGGTTKATLYFLGQILGNTINAYKYLKSLKEVLKKNPDIPFILTLPPVLKSVKNKSKLEKNLKQVGEYLRQLEYSKNKLHFDYDRNEVFEMMQIPEIIEENGLVKIKDKTSKFLNVINENRYTVNQPEVVDRRIVIFGNSVAFGAFVEDKNTIESHLQRILNTCLKNNKIIVLNSSNILGIAYDIVFGYINSFEFQKDDVAVIHAWSEFQKFLFYMAQKDTETQKRCEFIKLQQYFERPHDLGEVFFDGAHLGGKGNKKIAEVLFEKMMENGLLDYEKNEDMEDISEHSEEQMDTVKKEESHDNIIKVKEIKDKTSKNEKNKQNEKNLLKEYEDNPELEKYIEFLKENKVKGKHDIVGSIVMNCNPFTLGHRYLIETAASQVDYLYIFVVEEDKSEFPFEDRIKLVERGVSDLKNVKVLPSGKFIISRITFKDYFMKEKEVENRIVDTSLDVNIFAQKIAPVLNIKKRFVGEEPYCEVTRHYNLSMDMILPKYGIEFVVIKRKETLDEPISASRVRRLLEENNFDEIKQLVPKTTYDYLMENGLLGSEENHNLEL